MDQDHDRKIDVHADHGAPARELVAGLHERIREIHVAMLTTVTSAGHLRSRPMMTLQSEREDELWLYMDARSTLLDDITDHHQVSLAYVDPQHGRFVSVSGIAHVVRDAHLLERHWHPSVAKWFPDGPKRDPHLALLRVQLEEAETWDTGKSSSVKLFGFARSEERSLPKPPPPVPPEAG